MKRNWLGRTATGATKNKSHRICRNCHEIIRKHERWRQVKRKIFGIFGTVFEIEHRDCKDPTLAKAKQAEQPEPPMEQWLRENQLPTTTWTGASDTPEAIH